MPKKPRKVVIPESALKDIPEAEREALKAHLTEMFQDFDFDNPPGQKIDLIGATDPCPSCQGPLRHEHTAVLDGEPVEFVECLACDRVYRREPLN